MLMEKSQFNDLKYFIFYFYHGNMLKLNNNISYFPRLKYMNLLTIKFFTHQILQSLVFFKEHYLIHCDIKAENLLLCNRFILKLCDFSLMKLIINNSDLLLTNSTWNIKGIEYYNKHKIVNNKDVYKVDIFYAGLVIYLLMYNKHIISKDCKIILQNEEIDYETKIHLIKEKIQIAQNEISNDDLIKDNDFKQLIISMIEPNISDRSNIENLLMNKSMNNDNEIIKKIYYINECEEIKLFVEFQKI
jgi:serine/threonine protein kinase